MPCSKTVPLYRLVSLITRKVPARRLRLVCLIVFFTVALSGLPIHHKHDGVNAQSGGIVSISPGGNQTPDPGQSGTLAVEGILNNGHGSTLTNAGAFDIQSQPPKNITQMRSARWSSFQGGPSVGIIGLKLKFDWTASGDVDVFVDVGGSGSARIDYNIYYSIDGGATWTNAVSRFRVVNQSGAGDKADSILDGGSVEIVLSPSQDISLVQVRDTMRANAVANAPNVVGAEASSGASIRTSVSSISLEFDTVNCFASVPADRWKGEYFNNQALSGSPAMVTDDSLAGSDFLNRDFGGGSPSSICGVIPDNFSARWTRTVNFAQGIYRFTAGVDNGVRLYIDGYLRLDRWGELPPNTYRADAFLSAGAHEIKLEFIEYSGGASVSLSWTAVAAASGNIAFGKTASQSSTYSNATADRAIDGNTSGNYYDNSVNHTNFEHQPWWQVDLGSVQQIGEVILWNRTDGASERLSNFYVLVSDAPFNSTDLATTINQAGVSSYYTADAVGVSREIGVYRSGRYVRVQLAGDNYLHLAEVVVRGVASRSLAFGKSASQSSTAWGGDAFRAVDSNTSGNFYDYSVTHTNYEHQPWWQVDLGSVQQIGAVILWNRTDAASDRLSNFYMLVSDNPFGSTDMTATINQAGVSNYYTAGPVGVVKEIGVYRSGRYVRVQLAGDNYLHLAEVEVRSGASGSGCVASVSTDRWKGEYFNNTALMGSPAMVRDDGASFLDFYFGLGTPSAACGLSPELFSARWTRTVNFGSGLYRFSATGDDGVRLYVDGQLKIDAWVLQSPTTYTADVTLSAGPHDIRLEFYEYTGGATAFLSWRLVPVPNCLQSAPLIGAAPRTGAGESVTTTPASEAPKRCGQKSSD